MGLPGANIGYLLAGTRCAAKHYPQQRPVRLADVEAVDGAEGIKQARILEAEGEAQAIKLINEAANQYFVGNAQLLRRLETVERALADNAKIVVPGNTELINVIGDMAGLLPVPRGRDHGEGPRGAAPSGQPMR